MGPATTEHARQCTEIFVDQAMLAALLPSDRAPRSQAVELERAINSGLAVFDSLIDLGDPQTKVDAGTEPRVHKRIDPGLVDVLRAWLLPRRRIEDAVECLARNGVEVAGSGRFKAACVVAAWIVDQAERESDDANVIERFLNETAAQLLVGR